MPRLSKKFALLLVLSMLATMFMGMGTVSAAGSITALSVETVDETTNQALGAVKVVIPAGSIQNGDTVLVSLSSDFEFGASDFDGDVAASTTDNEVVIPATISADGDANGLLVGQVTTTTALAGEDSFQMTATADQSLTNDFVFYLYLDDIDVTGSGDAIVTFDAAPGSGFPSGDVLVGKSVSDKTVSITVKDDDTSDNIFDVTLRLKEDLPGALLVDAESLELTLPDAYKWTSTGALNCDALWGEPINLVLTPDDEVLTIQFRGVDANADGDFDAGEINPTATASAWDIDLEFKVADDDEVKLGDITAKIKGETNTNISSAVVGTYGEISATIACETPTEVISGQDEQEIGDIVISESLEGSLVDERSITLTLPEGCAWQPVYEHNGAVGDPADLDDFDIDDDLSIEFDSYTGADDRTAKFLVKDISTGDGAEVVLEDVEIAVRPGFSGDVTLEVGGTNGLTGSIVVAKAISAVTLAPVTTALPECIIGKTNQAIADFTIKENIAAGMQDDLQVRVTVPPGTLFTNLGTVKVTEGDLTITDIIKDAGGAYIAFTVKSESTVPSTVTVTGETVRVDRTVAEGNQTYKIKGTAVTETQWCDIWDSFDTAAAAALATVVTPAPTEEVNGGVFVIGSTSYTIGGVTLTADVAPYIKDSRTYLPVRYVAQALGIIDSNIMWDAAMQTVTLMKGDKVVQMKIGSNVLLVNGAAITLDVAPEISNGRTCLPIALVANAFGATASWDAATQTVTIK